MRQNPVRIALRNRQMAHGVMATEFLTPGLCQILANAGAEYVIFDMEHGGMGIDAIKAQCAFARNVGVVPLVRVTDGTATCNLCIITATLQHLHDHANVQQLH